MRALLVIAGSTLAAISAAQMSVQEATNKVNGMNGVLACSKEARIWAYTASDKDLIAALRSGPADKAIAAAYESGNRPHAEVVEAVSDRLENADPRFGLVALYAFNESKTREARMGLFKAVDNNDQNIRWTAGILSGKLGFRGSRPALIDAVKHNRLDAIEVLAKVGQPQDASVLYAFYQRSLAATHPNWGPEPDKKAILAMATLKSNWAIAKLRSAIDGNGDPYFRADAIHTLAGLKQKEDENRFRHALKDSNLDVQAASVEALGILGSEAAVSDILAFASAPSPQNVNARVNDLRWRTYARVVAQNICAGKKPISKTEWGMQNPPYKFMGNVTAVSTGANN